MIPAQIVHNTYRGVYLQYLNEYPKGSPFWVSESSFYRLKPLQVSVFYFFTKIRSEKQQLEQTFVTSVKKQYSQLSN